MGDDGDKKQDVPVEAPLAEVLDKEEPDYFRDIQAGIYKRASDIVEDTLRFAEIEPDAVEPPPEWVELHGPAKAKKMFRMAKAGWLTQKDAPIGTMMAARQVLGIMKAKAMEEAAPRSLSITLVQGTTPTAYPEKVLEEGKDKGRF